MKRWLLIFGPMLAVWLIATTALQMSRPTLERWVLENLESFSNKHLPVTIVARQFHFDFFLPKAELADVKIWPKPELQLGNQPISVDRATAKLDFLQLIAGRLQLSGVVLEGVGMNLDLDPFLKDPQPAKKIDWDPLFKALRKIPVTRIAFQSASLHLESKLHKAEADLIEFDLLIVNELERLQARLDLLDADLTWDEITSPLRAQAEIMLSPQGLDIVDVRVLGLGSLLQGTASFTNLPMLALAPEGSARFELKASLPQVEQLLKKMRPTPPMQGSVEAKGYFSLQKGAFTGGDFRIFGQKLKIDKFDIGQFETEGRISKDSVVLPHVALTHSAGLVDLTNVEIGLTRGENLIESANLKGSLKADSIDLHELLAKLDVGDLPLEVFVGGQLECGGPLWPSFTIKCSGRAEGDQLEIFTGKNDDKSLVALDHFEATGNVFIDLEKVGYEADLKVGQDQGKSSGVISYEKGFKIDYSTPKVAMSHIKKIADLKLEGTAKIQGRTSGTSKSATFQMQVAAENFAFEDFILGQPQGSLKYEKGILSFEDLQGTLGATSYTGRASVDLHNDQMETQMRSERLDLVDVRHALERRLKIPVEITGTGVAEVNLMGPLEINHLTYQAKAQLSRVSAVGETFDQVFLEAHSNKGEFVVDRAVANKGIHQMILTGEGHPSGQVRFVVEGKDLPLEQSENVALLGSNISGLLNFNLLITDQIRSPHLLLKTNVRNIVIEEQELPETTAEISLNPTEATGEAHLVGNRLRSTFRIPFREDGPFALDVEARDWSFTSFFALLGAGPLLSEYQSSLTGTLSLKSEQGGFWRSSGKATAERIFLKRGNLSLENPKPLEVTMRNGAFSFENFLLKGPSTELSIKGSNNTREALDIHMQVATELRLFQIFLPFLEELAGRASGNMSVGGSIATPELLGSAKTENAYIKIKGFPHPFEKIQSDVQFSQSKVLINSARGDLAGGTFEGDGSINIQAMRELPTLIRAQLNNVTLNVPDHVRTSGSGEVTLSGSWFPFTLSGVYRVQSGLMDKEFADDGLQNMVHKSSYLPKMILQKAFEPIVLDMQIILEQPLLVKNSMMDGSVAGQLQVKGTPTNPLLFGQITADKSTKLLVRDKTFNVTTANVKFNDPKEINPELYVVATSRVNEYDVNLLVQGNAKSPIVRMTSLPPLSESDIVSLLALGVTSEAAEKQQNKSKDQQSSGAFQIGGAALQQWTPIKQVQKAVGVNIQLSSNYDDTKNVEVKTVTVTKQMSEKVKISASQSQGDQNSNQFKVEYLLNQNWSAIGNLKQQQGTENSTPLQNDQTQKNDSIFGLDLEYRQEFK